MSRIIVTVDGGVAEVDQSTIPKGIEVEIRDYDCGRYGSDDVKEDDNGDIYIERVWSRVT